MSGESVIYSIEAPNGQTYKIPGPPGASQEDVQAEVLRQHPDAVKPIAPQARTQGTNISSDVPQVITEQNRGSVAPTQAPSSMADKLKALYEVPATIGSGMIAQPVGAAYGVYKGMTSPEYGTQAGVQQGQQAGAELANKLQFQPTSPVTQDVLGAVGGAMEAAKLPVTPGGIGQIPSFAQQARNVGQFVKPFASEAIQTAKPAVNQMAQALRREPSILKTAPSTLKLEEQSNALFKSAKDDGIEINPKDFAGNMKVIGKELEDIGYDADLHPDVATVLKRLSDPNVAKDFNKIKALRTMIGDLQNADTPLKKNIATTLKDEFDGYLANIPESSLVGGTKEGIEAWKNGIKTWSQLKKSEVFDDLLNNADIKAQRYSQSGKENYLYQKLSDLAVNKKKMRYFTSEEQDAIREAAKGGNVQNVLRMVGKYSPSSVLATAGGSYLGASLLGPAGAVIAPALGAGAKAAATRIRINDTKKLAALMRAGAPIVKEAENE